MQSSHDIWAFKLLGTIEGSIVNAPDKSPQKATLRATSNRPRLCKTTWAVHSFLARACDVAGLLHQNAAQSPLKLCRVWKKAHTHTHTHSMMFILLLDDGRRMPLLCNIATSCTEQLHRTKGTGIAPAKGQSGRLRVPNSSEMQVARHPSLSRLAKNTSKRNDTEGSHRTDFWEAAKLQRNLERKWPATPGRTKSDTNALKFS